MKTNAIRMFLALSAACLSGTALHAQSYDMSAKIPFAFHVAGKDFPAGKYLVRESGSYLPMVQSVATGHSVFVVGADHSLSPVSSPKLVFHCYNGATKCFLAEIQTATGSGSRVSMTKAEKEIANGEGPREMATISISLRQAD